MVTQLVNQTFRIYFWSPTLWPLNLLYRWWQMYSIILKASTCKLLLLCYRNTTCFFSLPRFMGNPELYDASSSINTQQVGGFKHMLFSPVLKGCLAGCFRGVVTTNQPESERERERVSLATTSLRHVKMCPDHLLPHVGTGITNNNRDILTWRFQDVFDFQPYPGMIL